MYLFKEGGTLKLSSIYECFKKLYFRYLDDEVTALSAQSAYYLLLSLFPFLLFFITILSHSTISNEDALEYLEKLLPDDVYIIIENSIYHISQNKNQKLISFGLITSLWAASNGVSAITHALNKAYDEKEKRPFWQVKSITILFTIALAFVIIFSFILLIFGQLIGLYIVEWLELSQVGGYIWNVLRYIIILPVMIFVFAALFKYMPCKELKWREVMAGSIFTTIGWMIISLGFAYYVNNLVNYSKIYGSIGAVMVLLIWLFLSAMVIILGGELNAILALDREEKEKTKLKKD